MKKGFVKAFAAGMVVSSAIGLAACNEVKIKDCDLNNLNATYQLDQTLDNLKLKIEFEDNTEKVVTVTTDMIKNMPDMSTPGKKEIIIVYEGQEFKFEFDVIAPTVGDVSVTGYKAIYELGETFSLTGTKLLVDMSYGTDPEVPVTSTMIEEMPDMTTAGQKTIIINYNGEQYTYTITVNPATVEDSSVIGFKATYELGETFSLTGTKIVFDMSYGEDVEVAVTSAMIEEMPDMTTAGPKTITINYNGAQYTYTITVNAATIQSSSITGFKTTYELGETFSLTGTKLVLDMSYGEDVEVSVTNTMIEEMPDMTTAGQKTITVVYEGREYTYNIVVNPATVVSGDIIGYRSTYELGESFVITGTQLVLEMSAGENTRINITEAMIVEMPDMTTVGQKTITVEYEDEQYTYTITVNPATVREVSVVGYRQVYELGDSFSLLNTKLVFDMSYGEDVIVNVTDGMIEEMPDMTTAGQKTITVEYDNEEYTYTITVNPATVRSGSVTGYIESYVMGDTFILDNTNLVLDMSYGDDQVIAVTESMIAELPDMATAGIKTIVVRYNGQEYTYSITVKMTQEVASQKLQEWLENYVSSNKTYNASISGSVIGSASFLQNPKVDINQATSEPIVVDGNTIPNTLIDHLYKAVFDGLVKTSLNPSGEIETGIVPVSAALDLLMTAKNVAEGIDEIVVWQYLIDVVEMQLTNGNGSVKEQIKSDVLYAIFVGDCTDEYKSTPAYLAIDSMVDKHYEAFRNMSLDVVELKNDLVDFIETYGTMSPVYAPALKILTGDVQTYPYAISDFVNLMLTMNFENQVYQKLEFDDNEGMPFDSYYVIANDTTAVAEYLTAIDDSMLNILHAIEDIMNTRSFDKVVEQENTNVFAYITSQLTVINESIETMNAQNYYYGSPNHIYNDGIIVGLDQYNNNGFCMFLNMAMPIADQIYVNGLINYIEETHMVSGIISMVLEANGSPLLETTFAQNIEEYILDLLKNGTSASHIERIRAILNNIDVSTTMLGNWSVAGEVVVTPYNSLTEILDKYLEQLGEQGYCTLLSDIMNNMLVEYPDPVDAQQEYENAFVRMFKAIAGFVDQIPANGFNYVEFRDVIYNSAVDTLVKFNATEDIAPESKTLINSIAAFIVLGNGGEGCTGVDCNHDSTCTNYNELLKFIQLPEQISEIDYNTFINRIKDSESYKRDIVINEFGVEYITDANGLDKQVVTLDLII